MSWALIVIATFGAIILLLFWGIPVAVSLGVIAILANFLFLGRPGLAHYVPWQVYNSIVLCTIPLFILMGEILLHGKLSERLYEGSTALLGKLPGGLLHANIASCAMFAAISGSSVATAATMGTMAIPELTKRGYERRLVLGSLAGGGTLGILIPPSIPLIIYAVLVEQSIGDLFIAGILPGIMLALLFMVYIAIRVKIQPELAPPYEGVSLKETVLKTMRIWPLVIIMAIILGGIYLGVMTPTESASVAAIIALIFAVAYRNINWSILQKCLLATVKTSTMVLFIIVGAVMVAGALGQLRVPLQMASWVTFLGLSPLALLICIFGMYIFLGCFFDGLSMMVLTLPVVFPIVIGAGYDPIWFGIALVVLIEMAALTPPVGLNLYTIHGLEPDRPMSDVIIGSIPFFLMMIVALAILTAFPSIAIWLPSTIRR